jgi:signal transduction histidine kinase
MSEPIQDDFDMLNTFAHDLKTPLSGAKGFLGLLHGASSTDKQRHYAERAMVALERMEQMINELLDYARLGVNPTIDKEPCDVARLIEEGVMLVEDLAAQRNITIHLDIASELSPVAGDERLLGHVVTNLLSNAVKYNLDDGAIYVNAQNEGTQVRLTVRDTGLGIPDGDIKRIFERFYRVKRKSTDKIEGTGLGLAIVQMVVLKHSGHIHVQSKLGEGSTFTVMLPRADVDAGEMSPNVTARRPLKTKLETGDFTDEIDDGLDDDMQESPERRETDSSSDSL